VKAQKQNLSKNEGAVLDSEGKKKDNPCLKNELEDKRPALKIKEHAGPFSPKKSSASTAIY